MHPLASQRAGFLLALTLILASCSCSFAANPSAGLEATPQWTSSDQLKAKWGSRPLPELRTLAEKGDPEAQNYLGWLYFKGEGVAQDVTAAATWFRKAAEKDFALGQNNLATFYVKGQGVPKDLAEAVRWYQRAAAQGLPLALANLGRLSAAGEAGLKREDSQRFYEQAAERGDLDSAVMLGWSHLHPGPGGHGDPTLAVYWLSFAAQNGCVRAYNIVGWFYMDGVLVPRDLDEAQRWFIKGAMQGEPYCELGLAMHELQAHKATPDLAKARRWMLAAAEKQIAPAFYELGQLSELQNIQHDSRLQPDYAEAAQWYQRAADAGHRQAATRLAQLTAEGKAGTGGDIISRLQRASDLGSSEARLELARRYWHNEGKPRNAEDAPLELMRSLIRGGNSEAMLQLADCYRTGTHVSKDPLQALVLLHAAARRQNGEALERFTDLRRAARERRHPAEINLGLEETFPLYLEALRGTAPSPAARIARSYLQGPYPLNEVAAYAWFSLAAERGDTTAASERERLLKSLNAEAKAEAEREARRLSDFIQTPLPEL